MKRLPIFRPLWQQATLEQHLRQQARHRLHVQRKAADKRKLAAA